MSPACECPLAGWCERHKRTKSEHTHHLCQTDARYRANWDKAAKRPKIVRDAENLIDATARWLAAGSPVRSKPEIDAAFSVCELCEFYTKGKCGKCGCHVSRGGVVNKIRMATEHCPVGKW